MTDARRDMTEGPIFGKIIRFAIPIVLSGVLQQLYNAADMIVVGRFAGSQALAAVGATGALINMVVSLFVGFSVGTGITVSNAVGARDGGRISRLVHSSMSLAAVAGIVSSIVGVLAAPWMLSLLETPPDIIDQSVLYMRLYFSGALFSMLYNFGAAIMRAAGDSRRPFVYLALSGIANVALNLIFVLFFNMGVAGVALATVVSQAISAGLVFLALLRTDGPIRLSLRELRFSRRETRDIIATGLPAGLQSLVFSGANTLIQSHVNSFESTVMAGSTASANIESFIYIAMNAFHVSTVTIVGQNNGAGRYNRIPRVLWQSILLVSLVGFALGGLAYVFGEPLLRIYLPDAPESVVYGLERMRVIALTYFLCGTMEVLVGAIRGMGSTFLPMVMSVIGVCGGRLSWIYTVFIANRSLANLYLCFPFSWVICILLQLGVFTLVRRRLVRGRKQGVSNAAP